MTWSRVLNSDNFDTTDADPNSTTATSSTVGTTDDSTLDADDIRMASNDSVIILNTFRVFGTMYFVCLVSFCLLRKYVPRLYNIRSWVPELKGKIAKMTAAASDSDPDHGYGFISWFWKVFRVDDERILNDCGMDALCFIRALRFGRKLSILGCFNAVWLIPMYATAEDSAETSYLSDPLVLASISNVPSSSKRFLGTVLAAYVTFFYAMYLLYQEMLWFVHYRHMFLSLRLPRNYAVYVSGIPKAYRSSTDLAQYFRLGSYEGTSSSSSSAIYEAHIAMNIPALEAKVARREKLVRKIEHAIALEKRNGGGTRITHRQLRLCSGTLKRVDSVATFEKELNSLNREISFKTRTVLNANDPLRSRLSRVASSKHLVIEHSDDGNDDEANGTDEHDDYGDAIDDELKRILSDNTDRERAMTADREEWNTGVGDGVMEMASPPSPPSSIFHTSTCFGRMPPQLYIQRRRIDSTDIILEESNSLSDAEPMQTLALSPTLSTADEDPDSGRQLSIQDNEFSPPASPSGKRSDSEYCRQLSSTPTKQHPESQTDNGGTPGQGALQTVIEGVVYSPSKSVEGNAFTHGVTKNEEKMMPLEYDLSACPLLPAFSIDANQDESHSARQKHERLHQNSSPQYVEFEGPSTNVMNTAERGCGDTASESAMMSNNQPASEKVVIFSQSDISSDLHEPGPDATRCDRRNDFKRLDSVRSALTEESGNGLEQEESGNGLEQLEDDEIQKELELPTEVKFCKSSGSSTGSSFKSKRRGNSRRTINTGKSSDSSVGSSSRSILRSPVVVGAKAIDMGSRAASFAVSTASTSVSLAGSSVVKGSVAAGRTIAKGSIAAGKGIASGSRAAGTAIKKVAKEANVDKMLEMAGEKGMETLHTAKGIGSSIVTSAGTVVPLLVSRAAGSPRDAGFVVFSTLQATQMALQMIQHPRPNSMNVQEAPDPGDIFWRNVGMPYRARRTGLALSVTATAVLCVFWSIPISFISSLTEVNSLKQMLPELAAFIAAHPAFETLLALLAPVLLLFINEVILPWVLKFFATWEGHVSSSMLEASLFLKLGCYMIIQTFFVSAISGSIFAEITNIMNDPASIIDLLANSLPAQSSYFMQVLLTQTFILQSIELLRVHPLLVALLRRFVGPNLTKKERRRTWGGINSLEDPPDFWHAETFAQNILYFMVYFVYAVIAPATSFFLLFCFLIMESGYRFQFFHNYPVANDTGGRLWRFFIQFTMASMIIAQLTLVGLLALKQSYYAGPAIGPLICITLLFILCVSREFSRVISFLPTRDCAIADNQLRLEGEGIDGMSALKFLKGAYLQPALKQPVLLPEYEDEDDVVGEGHDGENVVDHTSKTDDAV